MRLDPQRLVTASHAGDIAPADLRDYLLQVRVDLLAPHRPRHGASAAQTKEKTEHYLKAVQALGRVVPVHYQEPFRRSFGWQPHAEDFLADWQGAQGGGAAGWCFHNGDDRAAADGQPRRSFDLRERRLFDQFDEEETKALVMLANARSVEREPAVRTPAHAPLRVLPSNPRYFTSAISSL